MKYILIFVCWTASGGAPATAEFDDEAACIRVANELHNKLWDTMYIKCWPKGTAK